MILYGVKNDEGRYLLVLSGEGYFFTPTIPFRQLVETQKQANQIAVKISKKKPEWKDRLTIAPIEVSCGEAIEVVYPPVKEEDEE